MARATANGRPWTTTDDVLSQLRRRWQTGEFLASYASAEPWAPLSVAVRGPAAAELADRFGEVQQWVLHWKKVGGNLMRLEYKSVGGRIIGANDIPCRVWVEGYEQLWSLLGVTRDAHWFVTTVEAVAEPMPRLAAWMRAHPMKVLDHRSDWVKIVDTVRWIHRNARVGMYVRQVDVPGVDTKFIENHRGILAELLDVQLEADRVDATRPRSDFAGRYGFRKKPEYVRFRLLGQASPYAGGFSELTVRAEELRSSPPNVSTVYIVENEVTYLALPRVDDAMVIFGSGYAVTALESVAWLADVHLVYWGDIDTHGYSILNRFRQRFEAVSSMLMDRSTLLAHESQWVTEVSPVNDHLDRLRPDEADLYRDLVEGSLGPAVRLEQERVRFSAVEQALRLR